MEPSKNSLLAWHQVVRKAEWLSYQDAKQTYGKKLDLVGDCAVFDIHGNDFRLITRIRFKSSKVFVLKIMPHKDYDNNKWKEDCGCFADPPAKTVETVSVRTKDKQ